MVCCRRAWQASPYTLVMMVVPTHWLTHMVQLFFTAVWATYIHDGLEGDTEPIMGSKYHLGARTHLSFLGAHTSPSSAPSARPAAGSRACAPPATCQAPPHAPFL